MLFQPSSPSRAMLWLLRFFLSLLLLHLATAKGLCEIKNGDCQHFCNVVLGNVECSCADGYFLASDDKSCESNEPFKCGVIVKENNGSMTEENITLVNQTDPDNSFNSTGNYNLTTIQSSSSENSSNNRILQVLEEEILSAMATKTHPINGDYCPPGDCPWQALLLDQDNRGFCGGTILNEYIILTAAHCMNESRLVSVRLGEFDVLVDHGIGATHQVESIIVYSKYKPETYHNDIALIKLATPIKFSRYILPACLPEPDFAEKVLTQQPHGMVSGFFRLGEGQQLSTILQRLTVPYVDHLTCRESINLPITSRMFCAGHGERARYACQGDIVGPHVTRYHDTYFVTGVVTWGGGCAREYGVYTKVFRYIHWIREGIRVLMPKEGGSRVKRHRRTVKKLYL